MTYGNFLRDRVALWQRVLLALLLVRSRVQFRCKETAIGYHARIDVFMDHIWDHSELGWIHREISIFNVLHSHVYFGSIENNRRRVLNNCRRRRLVRICFESWLAGPTRRFRAAPHEITRVKSSRDHSLVFSSPVGAYVTLQHRRTNTWKTFKMLFTRR